MDYCLQLRPSFGTLVVDGRSGCRWWSPQTSENMSGPVVKFMQGSMDMRADLASTIFVTPRVGWTAGSRWCMEHSSCWMCSITAWFMGQFLLDQHHSVFRTD